MSVEEKNGLCPVEEKVGMSVEEKVGNVCGRTS